MNIEAPTHISGEQVVYNAFHNLGRAIHFEVILTDFQREALSTEKDLDPEWLKTNRELRTLIKHSIFHSLIDLQDYGSPEDLIFAKDRLRELKTYQETGLISIGIVPEPHKARELAGIVTEFSANDYENKYLKSHGGMYID